MRYFICFTSHHWSQGPPRMRYRLVTAVYNWFCTSVPVHMTVFSSWRCTGRMNKQVRPLLLPATPPPPPSSTQLKIHVTLPMFKRNTHIWGSYFTAAFSNIRKNCTYFRHYVTTIYKEWSSGKNLRLLLPFKFFYVLIYRWARRSYKLIII
jgi:hypothetical protein